MLLVELFVAAHLFHVHGPDGQEIYVNTDEISSVRRPRGDAERHFSKNTHCLIFMSNGHFIGTVETCEKVVEMIHEVDK